MEEVKEFVKRLEEVDYRLKKLEGEMQNKKQEKFRNVIVNPKDVEEGRMAYVGRYESSDKSIGSTFGADNVNISKLLKTNSFEMAQVVDAFSSEDRINIVKNLIQRSLTARQLMKELNFSTTGKLYHHLSFLEKIGVIRKDNEEYHVSARYISCILLIFAGVQSIINKNNSSD